MTTEAVALAGGIWRLLLARRAGVEVLLMPLEPQYVWLGSAPELAANGVEVGLSMTGHFMCATIRKACTLWRSRAGSVPQGATQLPVFVPLAARHGAGRRR